jgi:hypothetical protein
LLHFLSVSRHSAVLLFVLVFTGATPAVARADAPRAELWTMGPGHDVFSTFGHGAICMYWEEWPEGLCYNYGTAAFDSPTTLIIEFLRGRARFWVSVNDTTGTLRSYRRMDRTIYRQRLPLTDEQALLLLERVEHDALPENREYVYHHFLDNCTTRVRDHIDAVTGGALSRDAGMRFGPTWRDLIRDGFKGDLGLIMLVELLPSRTTDRYPTLWDAMFLPDVMRAEVTARLGVEPEILNVRKTPLRPGSPQRGRRAIALLSLALAAVCSLSVASGNRVARRAGLVVAGLVLGLAAMVVYALIFSTVVADLRQNEVAMVLLPTDLALVGLSGRGLRGYLNVRLGLLGVVAVLSLAGALHQPLLPALLLAGLPLGFIRLGLRGQS